MHNTDWVRLGLMVTAAVVAVVGGTWCCTQNPWKRKKQQKVLMQQRARNARIQYRKDCMYLFDSMSLGIQQLLALADCPDMCDAEFCGRLKIIAENESLAKKIASRKPYQPPASLTKEEKHAAWENMDKLITAEVEKNIGRTEPFEWEAFTEGIVPVLQRILNAAEAKNTQLCIQQIGQMRKILKDLHILVVYYSNEEEEKYPDISWDFSFEPGYPIPTLYVMRDSEMVCIGKPGRAQINAEDEEICQK